MVTGSDLESFQNDNSEMYTHRVIENITHYAHKINKLIPYSMNLLTDSVYYCQIMLSTKYVQKFNNRFYYFVEQAEPAAATHFFNTLSRKRVLSLFGR